MQGRYMYDSIMYGTTPTVAAAITRLNKDLTSHQVPTLNQGYQGTWVPETDRDLELRTVEL